MARTKQTARLCAQFVPRMSAPGAFNKRGAGGNRGRGRGGNRSASSDSSSSEVDVTRQQFSLKFDDQPNCEKKAIKAPIFECTNCKAILSHFSELQKMGSSQNSAARSSRARGGLSDAKKQELKATGANLWVCEFCDTKNQVPANIEVPKEENPCYYLGRQSKSKQKKGGAREKKQKMIIYCIDISGSMETVFQNKTRLEAVKEAIRDQIKRMKFEGEQVKVGIVTFGSEVNVMLKGKNIRIPPNIYYGFQDIAKEASKIRDFGVSVQTHYQSLEKEVKGIITYGCTALGPGLVTSIELAGRVRGSKIVLCTDGMANQGLNGPEFYNKAASFAKDKGVMISILSIKGDSCNLKQLGKLSLSTGGSMLKIDPNLFGSEFNKISKENVFGTDSSLRIVVNHFFQIQNAHPDEVSKDLTRMNQDFGNFTADTQLTFNFRVLSNEEAAKKGVSMEIIKRKRLPMQVQLTYINPDGQKYLQVVNDHRELTLDQTAVLGSTDFPLFSVSMLQKISKLIKEEKFTDAQSQIQRYRSLVDEVFSKKQSKKDLEKYTGRMDTLEKVLKSKIKKKSGGKGAVLKKSKTKKSTPIAKKQKKSLPRARGKGKAMVESESQSQDEAMASDSEEEVLLKEIRARTH